MPIPLSSKCMFKNSSSGSVLIVSKPPLPIACTAFLMMLKKTCLLDCDRRELMEGRVEFDLYADTKVLHFVLLEKEDFIEKLQ